MSYDNLVLDIPKRIYDEINHIEDDIVPKLMFSVISSNGITRSQQIRTEEEAREIAEGRTAKILDAISRLFYTVRSGVSKPGTPHTTKSGSIVMYWHDSRSRSYIIYRIIDLEQNTVSLQVVNVYTDGAKYEDILDSISSMDSYIMTIYNRVNKCYENHRRVSLSLRQKYSMYEAMRHYGYRGLGSGKYHIYGTYFYLSKESGR